MIELNLDFIDLFKRFYKVLLKLILPALRAQQLRAAYLGGIPKRDRTEGTRRKINPNDDPHSDFSHL